MASEVERIGEECRRYADHMVERMAESRAQREARGREMAERAAAEARKLRRGAEEHPDEQPPESQSFQLRHDEIERLRNLELRRQQELTASTSGDGGIPAQHAQESGIREPAGQLGDLDQREAIARAAAARRRNSVVAPIDDDGDREADYYRRNNWLV